jgi:hypothetical protein
MINETYTDYPFTAQGVNFISRVFDNSPFAPTVSRLPEGVFASMNETAIVELIGNISELSKTELLDELTRLNEGGSHAFILLGANA